MFLDRRLMVVARWFVRSLALASVMCGALAFAGIPNEIRVPGEIPGTALHAEGAQIYECEPDAAKQLVWQAREPAATLMDGDSSVGRHWETVDANTLVWEHNDGSTVKARIVARVAGQTADDLPWLKFSVVKQAGNGLLYGVTHVQRINTQGGLVRGRCDEAGAYRSVPYSADYVFWRAE